MELQTAILTGRHDSSLFIHWRGDLYPTYTQEEYDQMSPKEQAFLSEVTNYHQTKSPFLMNTTDEKFMVIDKPIISEFMYDVDGDGIDDHILYIKADSGDIMCVDTTQNGTSNLVLSDTSGNGKFDTMLEDTTGDGILDTKWIDTTGDGIFDTVYHKNAEEEWVAVMPNHDDNQDFVSDSLNVENGLQ
jgi:hypothetical protein